MGSAYLVGDRRSGEPRVLKVLHAHVAANPKARARFEQEVAVMARLKHPNAVALRDASTQGPQPFLVMEYVNGVTLDRLLARDQRLTPMRLRRLLAQLCDVLQAAHDGGIVHCDLKPANLMVINPETPFEQLKLMDFGLAQQLGAPAPAPGEPAEAERAYAEGTPGYMSPEQVRGHSVDPRSDLYSVGVILYHLLTGRLPFAGTTTMEVLMAQATAPPPSVASLGLEDWIPPAVEAVISRCLAVNPADRPPSARELAAAYEAALAREYSGVHRVRPPAAAQIPTPAAEDGPAEQHLQAWMPERVAAYKLTGFAEELGGAILENVPGLIRIRLKGPAGARRRSGLSGLFQSLGSTARRFGPNPVDLQLRLTESDDQQQGQLHVAVRLSLEDGRALPNEAPWPAYSNRVLCILRSYLMCKD
jgi:serine/threonine-protein kinase